MHSRSQISTFNDAVAAVTTGFEPVAFAGRGGRVRGPGLESFQCEPFDVVRVIRGALPEPCLADLRKLEEAAVKTPFQRIDWLTAWQAAIGADSQYGQAITVIAYQAGRAALALPLALHSGWHVKCLTWQCRTLSDYCGPLVLPGVLATLKPAHIRALLTAAGRAAGGADLIYLPKMPIAVGGLANPLIQPDSSDYYACAHSIRMAGSWQDFYAGHRSAKTRQSLRRKLKALAQMGELRFRLAQSPAEGEAIVRSGLEMKIGQLARSGHANPFSRPETRQFLCEYFGANLGGPTWAATLELDGAAIASAFGFRNETEWLVYQLSMSDGPEARFSPGIHLLTDLMRRCAEAGATRLDLSLGDEPYKLEWCNERTALKTTVLALTAKGKLHGGAIAGRAAVSAWLARNPYRYRIAKRLKPKLARLGIHV